MYSFDSNFSSFKTSVVRTMLLLCLIFTGLPSHAETKSATTILLFGDSIIAGYGLSEQNSLSYQLEKYLNDQQQAVKGMNNASRSVQIVNAGVSGDTTSAGLNRLAWSLKKNRPDLVFLALGGNDVLRGVDPSQTEKNIKAMLQILKDQNTPVILSKVRAPSNLGDDFMQRLNQAYEIPAKEFNVSTYPFLLTEIFTNKNYMQNDGIHPSAEGVQEIVKPLGDYLIEEMKKLNIK